ncbi:pirin family protein [Herbaspirillum sp. RTI4]|uniref:pirin family protein n=1 Tax=Herbaspirillum sp. RTI4 TaxID=3048640 RepID=UPI002AB3C2D3|nr:pirin family protein [Herbaspirillum sp. RTI4]MDY7578910.1 pirin family protein [Herbaspirillum sp. RTI4]MEA9981999.1 pirin family protein [Herbaspirillum sp. RTI4]
MNSILHLIHPQQRDIGFPVRRLLPAAEARSVGPFVFFDHMGPAHFLADTRAGDVRPHPHIGLATVTYLFSGAMMHRDSLGSVQRIAPGDINWMSAGRGIVHSERVPEDIRRQGSAVQGLQMWVALPQEAEESEPAFLHYPAAALPRVELPGVLLHVLAGQIAGAISPVQSYSRTLYVYGELSDDTSLPLAADYPEQAVYVLEGEVAIDGESITPGTLAILKPGQAVILHARGDSRFMLLGGDALDGPRYLWWNFVASSKEKIEAAKMAWERQDPLIFAPVPGDAEEFIPLPA